MLCALCTAAALAKLVDGIVRDDDGAHLSADQAIAQARELSSRVKPAEPRYGTRPADIKRYLKPLLELRSDLVVVGRHLFIRPVRHLLRGALFDPTSDKYRFEIMGYVHAPLWHPDTYGYDMRLVPGAKRDVAAAFRGAAVRRSQDRHIRSVGARDHAGWLRDRP